MKIASLKIERFGVWEDLSLPKISRGINVFFGPNEAGKTTLMQFIRTCLYGGADEDRARYIQMALDGRKRRERVVGQNNLEFMRSDPRRVNLNAAELDERSKVPDEIRRFVESSKKPDVVPADAKSVAKNAVNTWIGGAAVLTSDYGEHRLERRYIRREAAYQSAVERKAGFVISDGVFNWSGRFYSLPGLKIAESLIVTGPDGTRVGDYTAKSLTCNLDESTYNGVFAIGLDELQKLGMLNETEAAQMLYRLSVGVDRGAFVQVFQQIVAERNDLLDVKGRPSILENLVEERDCARQNATESAANLREYARLLEERRAVLEATKSLQERLDKAVYQKRLRELAVRVAPTWDERDQARVELHGMGDVPVVEQAAVDQCAVLMDDANSTRAKIKNYRNEYLRKRDERNSIDVDPVLDELAPRVKILEDDLPRLAEIDEKIGRLRDELADLNAKLAEEEARIRSSRDGKFMLTPSALDAINASIVASNMAPEAQLANGANAKNQGQKNSGQQNQNAPSEPTVTLPNKLAEAGLSFKEVEDYKIPARAMRRRRIALQKIKEEFRVVDDKLQGIVAKLEQGLTSHQQKNLTEAIERTGVLVTCLRRRIEVDRRVVEMTAYRKELERQNKVLVANQAVSGVPFYSLCAGAFVGALLFALALFRKVDLVFGLIGLLATIGCVLYKTTVEHRNRLRLEDNQRRLAILIKQFEQAQEEVKKLDDKLVIPVGQPLLSFDVRLQKAKKDLAFFESLVPVEAQWRETTKLFRAKEKSVKDAEENLKNARKRWRAWLKNACLPLTLKPSNVRDLLARVEIADDLRRQIETIDAEIDYLGRERQGIVDRFNVALALVARYQIQETEPVNVIPKLRALLDDHADVLQKRAKLLGEMNSIKKECRSAIALRRRQVREVRDFLTSYAVKSKEELVDAVKRYELYLKRVADLDAVQGKLDAAIADAFPEDELGSLILDPETRDELPVAIENLEKRIDAFNSELKGKLELSGRLGQQADAIAAKKDSIKQRFAAVAADLRLAKMAELWQSRAVAAQMMEDIRRAYEKERQPETLREASRYLKRLTNGFYVNIWTPLGEDLLYVDASNGETLDVAALSRGTRELLFIAIRLALVVSFEKHGVQMPLIWDDVLVNFDYARAETAAKLLVDFAKAGRQIFLFTCHEHICDLFLKLGVPVNVLPIQTDPAKRKFRVLLPKKGNAKKLLSVDVANPGEKEPSFVEETNWEPEKSMVVTPDPDEQKKNEKELIVSENHENELDLRVDDKKNANARVDSLQSDENQQDLYVDDVSEDNPDFNGESFSIEPDRGGKAKFAQSKNITLGDGRARFQPLSEISPTFSAKNVGAGNEFSVAKQDDEENLESAFDGDEPVEYVETEPEDSPIDAYDEKDWNEMFSKHGVSVEPDSDADKSFGEFLDDVQVGDDQAETEDEEYEDEEDELEDE